MTARAFTVAVAVSMHTVPVAAQQWTARAEYTVAAPTGGDSYWGAVGGIIATDSTFVVLDKLEHRLHAFDAAGKRLWSVGKEGTHSY